ncbi:MAG TPA: Ig-like domain-containing protein [Candidatus Dormibacteraeota bacterium]|nr:Ig-like domain-containing protein [Candidatus Dormibacteraeota bacterium]
MALIALAAPLAACGGSPPQIVDYSPQRGAIDVSTAVPIRITFDHDVDKASVETRLHLSPATAGQVEWAGGRQLTYQHPPLQPSTNYEVILDPGYRDLAGNVYTLRHHWAFVTEAAPALVGSTPATGDRGVDPAAYLALDFSRPMNGASLGSAITLYPTVPIDVRLDPNDSRRAVIAPSDLLTPNTTYQIAVNTAALDADGNQLDRDQTIQFTTGAVHALHGWITFAVNNSDGSPGGAWIVDAQGFPRRVYDNGPVMSFDWSPAGDRLLVQGAGDRWSDFVPGATSTPLPFKAPWAAALASGMGYVYIDESHALHRLDGDGADRTIAGDVSEAAVAPDGLRVAFVESSDTGTIWGYDVGLNARYQVATDTGPISSVVWAPSGARLAYLRSDARVTSLRVRNLTGSAATTTLATGVLGSPAWLPDSLHVVLSAAIPTPSGLVHKGFVLNVVTPAPALTLAAALPSDPGIDVTSPVPSPDGHQIAFISGQQVWLMNADGTRPTPLTKEDASVFPYSCRTPAWTRT